MKWLEKNSNISKRGDVYSAIKSEHNFYKLISKHFVHSKFSTKNAETLSLN